MSKIFHSQYVTQKDLWQGSQICKKCGKETSHHLFRIVEEKYIFKKVYRRKTSKYLSACDQCKTVRSISREKYERIYGTQMGVLRAGQFPEHIIRRDFAPDALHVARLTKRMYFATIFAILMTAGTVNLWFQIKDWNQVFFMGAGAFLVLGWLPFFLVRRKYTPMKKKYQYYLDLPEDENLIS
ncbi:MAG: hypothetical protein K6G62_00090 [Eubacterium sp.]|nr:hypothetical protein [Eubacterium sp.]